MFYITFHALYQLYNDIQSNPLNPSPKPWKAPLRLLQNEEFNCVYKCNTHCPLKLTLKTGQKVLIYESRNIFDIHFRRCGQLKKQPQMDPQRQWCSVTFSVCADSLRASVLFQNCCGTVSVKLTTDVSDLPNTYNK